MYVNRELVLILQEFNGFTKMNIQEIKVSKISDLNLYEQNVIFSCVDFLKGIHINKDLYFMNVDSDVISWFNFKYYIDLLSIDNNKVEFNVISGDKGKTKVLANLSVTNK